MGSHVPPRVHAPMPQSVSNAMLHAPSSTQQEPASHSLGTMLLETGIACMQAQVNGASPELPMPPQLPVHPCTQEWLMLGAAPSICAVWSIPPGGSRRGSGIEAESGRRATSRRESAEAWAGAPAPRSPRSTTRALGSRLTEDEGARALHASVPSDGAGDHLAPGWRVAAVPGRHVG